MKRVIVITAVFLTTFGVVDDRAFAQCDEGRKRWKLVGKLPMPFSAPAAAIIGGKLYVAGGSPVGSSVQGKMWVRDAP